MLHRRNRYLPNGSKDTDVKQKDVGIPDYSDLKLDQYLSVIEIANPMHRLWSDGRWNKLDAGTWLLLGQMYILRYFLILHQRLRIHNGSDASRSHGGDDQANGK